MRDFLRSLPVFASALAEFSIESLPPNPAELFDRWLREAVDDGVLEPHAMTLSTCDASGLPDARVLILKDVDEYGWWFATDGASAKGRQLADRAGAALTFYWPQCGRQVRVRGPVINGSRERSVADFRDRGSSARAIALAGNESQPLPDRAACLRAFQVCRARLVEEPDLVSASWQVYAVEPIAVEFWQADKDRMHTRVRYDRDGDAWAQQLLWP